MAKIPEVTKKIAKRSRIPWRKMSFKEMRAWDGNARQLGNLLGGFRPGEVLNYMENIAVRVEVRIISIGERKPSKKRGPQ